MEQRDLITTEPTVPVGTVLICTQKHPDADFRVGHSYKVNALRSTDRYCGVRVRDSKRQRKDFNFLPKSKSYLWHYFKLG